MSGSDKKFAASYGMFVFGFAAGLVVAVLVVNQGFLSSVCAKRACTVTDSCTVDGREYINGTICVEENASCGYISTCETIIDRKTNAPKCSCQFPF